jgi:hypothetical protein
MAWVSSKVYAILKNAQGKGIDAANFVDNIKEMSESEVEKSLNAFFKGGSVSSEQISEIYDSLEGEKPSEVSVEKDVGFANTKTGKIKLGDREARKSARLEEGLGSINQVLGVDKPVTKEDIASISKKLKLNEDGEISTAIREFSRPFSNPELKTVRKVKIKLPNGKMVEVAFYQMGSDEANKKRMQEGEKWKSDLKIQQENELAAMGGVKYDNEAFIVVGLPGAGKSVTAAGPIIKNFGAYEIDSDIFKDMMPESMEQADDGHMVLNSSIVHDESGILRDDYEEMVTSQVRDGKLPNLVLPTVGGKEDSLVERIDRLRKKGYKINLINAFATTENAMERNKNRFKEKLRKKLPVRYVGVQEYEESSVDIINRNYQNILENQGSKINSWAVYDGNRPKPAKPLFVDGSENWNNFFGDE